MSSPINSIPCLVPDPSPSPSKPSTPTPSKNQAQVNAEEAIDKFATLFSPATPRASPTLEPITVPPIDHITFSKSRSPTHPTDSSPKSPDSDFGSFVSVPATEDPLSVLSPLPSPSWSLPPQIQPSQSPVIHPNPRHESYGRAQSTSLNFFDKFTQDARRASEKNKRGLLDELLLHEDDPLYWLKDRAASDFADSELRRDSPENGMPEVDAMEEISADGNDNNTKEHQPSPNVNVLSDTSNSLLDLDSEFFAAKPTTTSDAQEPRRQSPSSSRRLRRTLSVSLPRSPTSSLPSLPSLAPPVSSSPPVSMTSSTPIMDQTTNATTTTTPANNRSMSYDTLSKISSRWMPPFRTPSPSAASSTPTPTLESIFAAPETGPSSSSPRHHATRNAVPTVFPSQRKTPTAAHSTTHHPIISASLPSQISHGTPFGPSSHPSTSPFASHVFRPPSGAPGYKGEEYDWDKGFSTDLERELNDVILENGEENAAAGGVRHREKELVEVKAGNGKGKHVVSGVGGLMEKKSGAIELKGRKAGTAAILEPKLASLIRPHFPALSRLPKTWTLIYSLDQHGISLNTLYARCDAQLQTQPTTGGSAGMLVVVKDSGNAVFGAWTGEGLGLSLGKGYHGSGESFLWKLDRARFQVFNWTGKNDYVALCEPDSISFGGGDGNYGLYLDDTLFDGSSARCPTFDNEPLCSSGPRKGGAVAFECVGLEVWGIGP